MAGSKTDVLNLFWVKTNAIRACVKKIAPLVFFTGGALLTPGCVMTKAQGDRLSSQVREIEDEMAKLQRVRHDMEVLLLGQVRDIVDRIARLESQLLALRESLTEGSSRNTDLVAELQNLRDELEQAQHLYRSLEQGQQSLARNQNALQEAQNKIRVPPLKEDHFALAKKLYLAGKFDEAVFLFDQFLNTYPKEKDLGAQSSYLLGEIYRKLGDGEKSQTEAENLYKRSVVSYQKIVEAYEGSTLREEALYKIGLVLKSLGNKDGAKAAFNELLSKHANGKRVKEAKKQIADLDTRAKKPKLAK